MQAVLRVLHVFDHSIPLQSGYAIRSRAILREQHALGIETVQITSSKHVCAGGSEQVDGLRFHRTARGRLSSLPVLDQYDVIHGLSRRLGQVLAWERVDLIHAHSPCLTGIAALRASRVFGLPLVYEVRALWEDAAVDHGTLRANGVRYLAQRALESWMLRRADAVVCICEGLRGEIVGRGIRPEHVTVVPNAVDLNHFAPSADRDIELAKVLGLRPGPVIGFIGSLYRYEGIDLLLEAMAQLRVSRPELQLLIVGGGPEESRLKSAIRDLDLQGNVVFVGAVPHAKVSSYYSLVELLIYPRRRTRLTDLVTPLKPLEGMAQGKPVLASDIGGHRELIRHGDTGILFPLGDARDIARAVDRVLASPETWPSMVAAGRRYVSTERAWSRIAGRYPGIYAAAIARHRRRVPGDRIAAPQG